MHTCHHAAAAPSRSSVRATVRRAMRSAKFRAMRRAGAAERRLTDRVLAICIGALLVAASPAIYSHVTTSPAFGW